MDLWIVGAAAAAGCIANHWQCVSRGRNRLSRSNLENHEKPSLAFHGLSQKKRLTEDVNITERLLDVHQLDRASETEVSSSGYAENPETSANYDESNVLALSSLPPGDPMNECCIESGIGNGLGGNVGDSFERPCNREIDSFYESERKTDSLRTKHIRGHFIKHLNSLESCLMAELYKEHTKMEEYVLSVLPSSSTEMRPVLVTDGNQIIDRLNGDSRYAFTDRGDDGLHKDENVRGIPLLPKLSKLDIPNKSTLRQGEVCNGRFSSSREMRSGRNFHSQNVPLNRTYLFCLGLSVRMASSLLASKREVDKLQALLKQTENLVQDLQEELETKDSFTVKELTIENCETHVTCENFSSYTALKPLLALQNVKNSTNNDG